MTGATPAADVVSNRRLSSLILGAGFGLTGAGTVMLGVLLPVLSRKWGLHDDNAGFLLFLQFSGSALGAVFTSANRIRSLIAGYALLTVSSCTLAFSGARVAFPVFFLFGLGLGMAMTATSLLFSDRWGDERAAKLEGLNFAWAAGATAAPVFFLPFLHTANLRWLFLSLQGFWLLLLGWVVLHERHEPLRPHDNEARSSTPAAPGGLLPLLVLAMCSVGIEASLSGWLTTYSHRAGLPGFAEAALATFVFWLCVVVSRFAFSTRLLARIGRHAALLGSLWGVAVAVVLLIAARDSALIVAASGLAGLCLGPVYPLLLSFLLERTPRGWIFAAAGMGAAILPWLTGLLSARFGSLRFGLIAPCAAGVLMIVLHSTALRPRDFARLASPSRT